MARDKELPSSVKYANIIEIIKYQSPQAVQRLSDYADVNLVESYADSFGQDPDHVLVNTEADTVIMFNVKWKDEAEFKERFDSIERMMSGSGTT